MYLDGDGQARYVMCQPSHTTDAFTKIGMDGDEPAPLAGPGLLVKQTETWLPLWLDGRRATAKQLADQECWGDPMPRPSLEALDAVLRTSKSTTDSGHDCVKPKAIMQLPADLHERFVDLLMPSR